MAEVVAPQPWPCTADEAGRSNDSWMQEVRNALAIQRNLSTSLVVPPVHPQGWTRLASGHKSLLYVLEGGGG
ncbi:hypothetical protein HaLaN_14089, partial [Haematococcus lacustris]